MVFTQASSTHQPLDPLPTNSHYLKPVSKTKFVYCLQSLSLLNFDFVILTLHETEFEEALDKKGSNQNFLSDALEAAGEVPKMDSH